MELLHSDISSTILKGFYTIAKALPFGLDKSFYCNALTIELQESGLKIDSNKQQIIQYKGSSIGQLALDIVANNAVLVEVSTDKGFIQAEQIEASKTYLKLTDFEVLLFLNFGLEADHKRVFLSQL